MRKLLLLLALIAISPLVAGAAAAQFQTMDRQGSSTRLQATGAFVVPDTSGYLVRTDLYGQVSFLGFGVYGALPITKPVDLGVSPTAVGNLEIGGIYTWDVVPTLDLVSHIGVAVPTASSGVNETLVNLGGHITRINDLIPAAIPDQTTLRIATSPVFELGPVFVRGDVGLDFAFPSGGSTLYLFRGNIGAGVNILLLTLTGEIANVGILNPPNGQDATFTHTASIGAVLNTPIVQPYLGFTSPLDEPFVGDVYEVALGLKLEF
jgi:hypothetical protein